MKRGPGRPKGSVNKTTASAKQAFLYAFDGMGGEKELEKWASANKTDFFKLFARLIPTEVTGPDGGELTVRVIRD